MTKRKSPRKKTTASSFTLKPEIIGLGLLALALLTLLSLLPLNRSDITEAWVTLLGNLFGWGVYLIWLIFGLLGIWFFKRYGTEDSDEKWEKPVGAILLFLVLLTVFDFISPGTDPLSGTVIGGGGYIGWILNQLLVSALDVPGTIVILIFLFLTAIIQISSLSIRELIALIREWYYRFQDKRQFSGIKINQPDTLLPDEPAVTKNKIRPTIFGKLKPERRLPKAKSEAESFTINRGEIPIPGRPPTASIPPAPGETPEIDLSAGQGSAQPKTEEERNGSKRWHLPILHEILDEEGEVDFSEEDIRMRAKVIEDTLVSFGVDAKVREINPGPAVTQFSLEPGYLATRDAKGNRRKVRVSKIVNLSNDLALALSAAPIRIEAPIPGRPYVGIEVPNTTKAVVALRNAMEAPQFEQRNGILKIALGRNVSGHPVVADLAAMPHLLIAGATGSGKSVCINSVVACLLCTHTPDTLRMLMIDPKMVELVAYQGIPHLLAPVVTDLDRVVGVLNWATREMDRRYKALAKIGARNIVAYNEKALKKGEDTLPYVVIIIDELADLMMMAPDEVERSITRIAQMARAVGIHLILATQRPSVDVVTGLIKANFPARIAFAVSSQIDSRVILDTPGAERLLGKGDMLYMAPDSAKLNRLQGVFVSDSEIERLIKFWGGGQTRPIIPMGPVTPPGPLEQGSLWNDMPPAENKKNAADEALLEKAVEIVKEHKRASVSLLQRRLRIGYARAARLIDELEEQGFIGPDQGGGQGREVLNIDLESHLNKNDIESNNNNEAD